MTDQEFEQPSQADAPEQGTTPIPMPAVPTAGTGFPPPPVTAQIPETVHYPTEETPSSAPPAGGPTSPPPGGLPYGTYALGALAGNPQLGSPSGSGYGGPPQNPGYPSWGAAPPPEAGRPQTNRKRLAAVIGAAAVIALAAGAGIGHVAWSSGSNSVSASSNTATTPASNGSGSSGSSGSGNPFGSGSSGSSNSSGSSGPGDVSAIANKVDPGLVDINTTLGLPAGRGRRTGIVLTSVGEILTNNHVIDGATTISVTDVGNGKTYSASVVGYDRTKDIAVLQLHSASGLQTANHRRLLERVGRRGRRRHRQRRRHRRDAERSRRNGHRAQPVDHRQRRWRRNLRAADRPH